MYLGIKISLSNHQVNRSIFHENEFWKDVPGYEGLYQASTLGRVKTIERSIFQRGRNGVIYNKILPSIFIKQVIFGQYYILGLTKNLIRKSLGWHRCIAFTFIENPANKPQVNHKNGMKLDCRKHNLEWCTVSENTIHSYRVLGQKPSKTMLGKTGSKCHHSIAVIKLCVETNDVLEKYGSIKEASLINHTSPARLKKAIESATILFGYKWTYK